MAKRTRIKRARKNAANRVLNEALAACEYWMSEAKKNMEKSGDPKEYGKINILGLIKMDLQHIQKHGYRYFNSKDKRPRDMFFWR